MLQEDQNARIDSSELKKKLNAISIIEVST